MRATLVGREGDQNGRTAGTADTDRQTRTLSRKGCSCQAEVPTDSPGLSQDGSRETKIELSDRRRFIPDLDFGSRSSVRPSGKLCTMEDATVSDRWLPQPGNTSIAQRRQRRIAFEINAPFGCPLVPDMADRQAN